MALDSKKIRKDFPILSRKINGCSLVYLDNAATTQKPKAISEILKKHYEQSHANVHRGVYALAEEATSEFEGARKKIADFVGAKSPNEIIFTRNATEAVNLVAYSLAKKLKKGDRILTAVSEHHSNFVPWLRLAKESGLKLDIVKLTPTRDFNIRDFKSKLTRKTKLVAVAHVSNVSGYIYPVQKIAREAHKAGALVLVDGAQSAGHMPVDVKKIDCDFFAFSAHKMGGPSGAGALYGKKEILEKLEPFLSGGEMVREVSTKDASWNDAPWKFEAGTPNIEGAILWGEAIDYLKKIGMKNIERHEKELLKYALGKLKNLSFINLHGMTGSINRTSIISFNTKGVHPHDAATLLDRYGICVRAGHHCAQPFMRELGVPATLRASLWLYNTRREIDILISALRKVHRELA